MYIYTLLYYKCYRYTNHILEPPVRPEGEGAQVEAAVLRRKLLVARMCVYIYIYIYI